MFDIVADAPRKYLLIRFDAKFWDDSALSAFRERLGLALISLNAAPGTHVVLVDLRDAVLQSQVTVEAAKQFVGSSVAAKIALVANSALARMQTKRLRVRENVQLFDDIETAEAWLFQ